MSMSLSNMSGDRKQSQYANNSQKNIDANKDSIVQQEDTKKLVKQNRELNELCASLDDEIHYLKLREKKIMYLVHLL